MERIVRCLSPVHIGTGKELEPFDYIVDGQRYIRVDLDAVLGRMTPEQADKLAAWVSEQADQMGGKQSNDIRRKMQLSNFPGTDAAWREALRSEDDLARYHGNRGFERNMQVREQVKDAAEVPLIPGSSLKGALRTALAFVALKEMGQGERQELEQSLDRKVRETEDAKRRGDNRTINRLKERIGQEIEQAVFRCGKQSRRDRRVSYGDIHYDLMRVVSVSDTYDAQEAELIVPQIYTFVEQRNRDGNTRLEDQAPLIAEAHAPGNTFRLRLQVDGRLLRAISRNTRRDEWIDFEQRVKRAFGAEVAELLSSDAPDKEIEQAAISHIEQAAQRFAKAVIAAELRWEDAHGYGKTGALKSFYKRLNDLIDKGLVPLRLGWGSHFMATTLLLALKEEDAGWRPILERCFRAFDIGVPPRGRKDKSKNKEHQIDLDDFPRSRRLIATGKKPVAPLGWIALAPTAEDLPGPLTTKEQLLWRPQERMGEGRRRTTQPAKSSPIPQSGPRANDRVMAELLAEKTKKGGWKAKHIDSGLEGPIQDSQNVPADAEPGQRVELTVASASSTGMQFKWAPPPASKKKSGRDGNLESRGKRRRDYL